MLKLAAAVLLALAMACGRVDGSSVVDVTVFTATRVSLHATGDDTPGVVIAVYGGGSDHFDTVVALVDGTVYHVCSLTAVESATSDGIVCTATVALPAAVPAWRHVSVYGVNGTIGATRLATLTPADVLPTPVAVGVSHGLQTVHAKDISSADDFRAGILYSVWHTFAATAYANLTAAGHPTLSIEQVRPRCSSGRC